MNAQARPHHLDLPAHAVAGECVVTWLGTPLGTAADS